MIIKQHDKHISKRPYSKAKEISQSSQRLKQAMGLNKENKKNQDINLQESDQLQDNVLVKSLMQYNNILNYKTNQ